jgi:hypothetical protein
MWRRLIDAASPSARIQLERHISPATGITSGRLIRDQFNGNRLSCGAKGTTFDVARLSSIDTSVDVTSM